MTTSVIRPQQDITNIHSTSEETTFSLDTSMSEQNSSSIGTKEDGNGELVEDDDSSMPDCLEDCLMSTSKQSEAGDDDDLSDGEEDRDERRQEKSNCSSMHSSMSLFISGLVGNHSGDQHLIVQVDNAKPRDLPQQTSILPDTLHPSPTKRAAISRWESTPTSAPVPAHKKEISPRRPRAMRPLPGGGHHLHKNKEFHQPQAVGKKDAPILRPQRMDSNNSLCKNECSFSDLGTGQHSGRHDSMDLNALIAEAEDQGEGIYVKVPALAASVTSSLWSSVSTMTTSSSSHFGQASTVERPMRCPHRTYSDEQQQQPPVVVPGIITQVSPTKNGEKPLRRPIRQPSECNVFNSNIGATGASTPGEEKLDGLRSAVENKPEKEKREYNKWKLLCPLKEDSDPLPSFKLSRASSDQSLLTMLTNIKKATEMRAREKFVYERAESEPTFSPDFGDNSNSTGMRKRCRKV